MRTNKNTQAQYQTWDYCRICYNVMNIQTDESTEEYRDEKKLHATMITEKNRQQKTLGLLFLMRVCVCRSMCVQTYRDRSCSG